MSIRVGTVVGINNTYNKYQKQLKDLKNKEIKADNDKEKKQIEDNIRMLGMEINEYLQLIIPDPEPSKTSPYLAKEYDFLYSNGAKQLDVEA